MSVIVGKSGPLIIKGASGPNIRGASNPNIVKGSNRVIKGASTPMVAVLNGTNAHIEIDGLAPVTYTQTGDTHMVYLVKKAAPSLTFWSFIGNNDATLLPWNAVEDMGSGTGELSALIRNQTTAALDFTGSSATNHADGEWHMLQASDQYTDPNGQVFLQVDGGTREASATYLRYAVDATYPKFFTLGALRRGVGGLPSGWDACKMGYYALVSGQKLSAANMDAIYAAFNTGGGRRNTRIITSTIQGLLSSGTLQFAGDLNGSAPHVGPVPICVNCTHEVASYG